MTFIEPEPMPPRWHVAPVVLIAIMVPGIRVQAGDDAATMAAVDRLLGVMNRRLAVMHDVARWKWANGVAISDPAREARVLDAVAERAKRQGLDPSVVRAVFAAQIEASKLIQQADFVRWEAGVEEPKAGGPDLAASRARIDRLDGELLEALAGVGKIPLGDRRREGLQRRAESILAGPGIDADVRARATRPLR
jgi:chorismate mutase